MKKLVIAVLSAGLLLAPAASASAETIQRNGAKKATITAVAAPAGTETVKARIWVKKGKKTVAKNKVTYRAKKGKYKVTSKVTYRTVTPTTVTTLVKTPVQTTADQITAECVITSSAVVGDRTVLNSKGMLDGTADVQHTGNCADLLSVRDAVSGAFIPVNWTASWVETGTVCVPWDGVTDKNAVILSCPDFDQVGQTVNLTGDRLSALPVYSQSSQVVSAGPVSYGPLVTVKSTRTVRVK